MQAFRAVRPSTLRPRVGIPVSMSPVACRPYSRRHDLHSDSPRRGRSRLISTMSSLVRSVALPVIGTVFLFVGGFVFYHLGMAWVVGSYRAAMAYVRDKTHALKEKSASVLDNAREKTRVKSAEVRERVADNLSATSFIGKFTKSKGSSSEEVQAMAGATETSAAESEKGREAARKKPAELRHWVKTSRGGTQ
ncbi:hypothetical protein B0H21DRAFT_757509 [Amylocystis lapponica]|nr:hypothetical protein B0H21DRAFT_757509 [Amylocystis lapponica]